MKKKLFLVFIVSLYYLFGNAQSENTVTVLYLLPFHLNEAPVRHSSFKSSAEIHRVKQFEMMGFWLGAKMALQEYEHTDKKINVIVRDAVTDIKALNKILEDSVLMAHVNMIIGPFYGSLFPIAAEFAEQHNIVIVNPFSTRFDFVEGNPYVYKLIPPFSSRPETIAELFLADPDEYSVILWGDSVKSFELQAYKDYFIAHNIHFKEVSNLTLPRNIKNKNLIIAFFQQPTRVIHGVHTLINREEETNVLVVPEKWLSISELTEDFFSMPHLYFFANYFVDNNCSKIQEFQSDHVFNYGAPAELAAYSYQGYDITRYFIDLYFADFDPSEVQFQPLSYQFQWRRILDGGLENSKARLIRVKDLELEEVK
ncbi:MAG: hypothetical protein FWC34_03695 [Bacteroidetes bacterium]|nr:hypothetical protein [Bacteroidota bacterium]MCL2302485.1 hypothetical protein [Lentimicrobiaceae bacterium]